jgi:hypothetical protein
MEFNKKVRPESQKESKKRRSYEAPEIIYEGAITIRAGTVIDPQGFGSGEPFGPPFDS